MIALLFFVAAVGAQTLPDLSSDIVLSELWHKQLVYFRSDKPDDHDWNGTLLHLPTKQCFELRQPDPRLKVTYRKVTCEAAFVAKANEPYVRIADFEQFKRSFLACADRADKKCLRGLISKTLETGFGPESYDDRRDTLFADWGEEHFQRITKLIRKGVYPKGQSMRFPPNAGAGWRGTFMLHDGGWLLVSYLAGD